MIYTITQVQKIKNDSVTQLPTFGDIHCLGFFRNIEDAILEVTKLKYKGYNFCIIEENEEGIEKKTTNRYIYQWSKDKNKYIQIDEPKLIHTVTNFGIG